MDQARIALQASPDMQRPKPNPNKPKQGSNGEKKAERLALCQEPPSFTRSVRMP